ncbi:hypothetical protein BaRGS_00028910, partial [Batillaria attramentaria]
DTNGDDSEAIEKQPWYWGSIPSDDASEIVQAGEPGQFLVRDSATPGNYTLVIRTENRARCVRIFRWDDHYGFAPDRCTFPSVTALVSQLLKCPGILQENYPHLRIERPLCKDRHPAQGSTSDMLRQLVCKTKECITQHHSYATLLCRRKMASKELLACERGIKSLHVVLSVYEDHIDVHAEIIKNLSVEEAKRLVEDMEIDREYLDLLLREETDVDVTYLNPNFWRVTCDRHGAEKLLADKVPGTFLVRPRNEGYVLSVRNFFTNSVETCHCVIHHDSRYGYGFHPHYCIFASVEELVIKHRAVSLGFYNEKLNVCLTNPVNYTGGPERTLNLGEREDSSTDI